MRWRYYTNSYYVTNVRTINQSSRPILLKNVLVHNRRKTTVQERARRVKLRSMTARDTEFGTNTAGNTTSRFDGRSLSTSITYGRYTILKRLLSIRMFGQDQRCINNQEWYLSKKE
jgi:hypothetical protein